MKAGTWTIVMTAALMAAAVVSGEEGPEDCTGDLVWNDCGSMCTKTCENYDDMGCAAVCHAGCECPKEKPIFHNGRCLTTEQCPRCEQSTVESCQQKCADMKQVPQPGTECSGTGCTCQDVCTDYNCGAVQMCVSQEVQCVRAPCMPQPRCQTQAMCGQEIVEQCQQRCADMHQVPQPGRECMGTVCICQDVCTDHECPVGRVCETEIVQCVRAPCMPQPTCTEKKCAVGDPLVRGGDEWPCFRGGDACPPGSQCTVHPADHWAVCCAVDENGSRAVTASSCLLLLMTTLLSYLFYL